MAKIELPKPAQEALAKALSRYLRDQHDVVLEGFDVVFLLDFITERMGPHFYNQGLADAQAVVAKKVDEFGEAIYGLEKPAKL